LLYALCFSILLYIRRFLDCPSYSTFTEGQSFQDGKVVLEHGLLYGFDWVVWLTVLWYCVGGLSVAVCIKYADNIAKNFATSVAIILATVGSMVIFNFQPSPVFTLGAALVIFSIFMYSSSQSMVSVFRRIIKTEMFV
ncbi:Nucleotide-sugar transporter, partial [Ancylostoma duodenale]